MLSYSMKPVVDPYDLAKAIEQKFGREALSGCENEMEAALFGDEYNNYCYQEYHFDTDPTPGYGVTEDMARVRSYANEILKEAFPDRTFVLISIYW